MRSAVSLALTKPLETILIGDLGEPESKRLRNLNPVATAWSRPSGVRMRLSSSRDVSSYWPCLTNRMWRVGAGGAPRFLASRARARRRPSQSESQAG